jgi:hypothetical protein
MCCIAGEIILRERAIGILALGYYVDVAIAEIRLDVAIGPDSCDGPPSDCLTPICDRPILNC